MAILISLVAVTFVLGIMILAHEWGHFVVAKLLGVRVNIFSIGFGPRLWGWKKGTTDYRLSALPFGGYVKMAGDNPLEDRQGAPEEFLSKPRWQRVIIAVAGPAMNIILAVLLMMGLFLVGAPEAAFMTEPARVAGVLPGSPAEQAGIRAGDQIAQINGVKNPKWDDALFELTVTPPGSPVSLLVDRNGQAVPIRLPKASPHTARDDFAMLGYPLQPVVVGTVSPDLPADKAGLKPGDRILSANGETLLSPVELAAMIRGSKGQPLSLAVQRGAERLQITARPVYGDPGDGEARWHLGFVFRTESVYQARSLPQAARRAIWFNVRLGRQIFQVIAGLFEGKVSLRQLEGPVGIARESGEAARRGPMDLINLMAVISLNLGILNLLPIPILDGGHVLMLAVEGTLRRDLSIAVKERVVQIGLVFLLGVFAFVMYYDVLRLLPSR